MGRTLNLNHTHLHSKKKKKSKTNHIMPKLWILMQKNHIFQYLSLNKQPILHTA